jgi:hypothetical protein
MPGARSVSRRGSVMRKQQVIGTRLVATVAVLLCVVVASPEAQRGAGGGRGGGAGEDPAAAPTPRLSNGKPDLTGSWAGGGWITGSGAPGVTVGGMFRRCSPFQNENCMEWTNQSQDWAFMATARLGTDQPLYKPEHWDKVIELDQWTNKYDPVMTCMALGVPRQGPPARIFLTENDITMIYRGGSDGAGGYPEFRMVRIDNETPYNTNDRGHNPQQLLSYSFFGHTIARWDGDTLVLDSRGFTDETWLARGGFFHSDQMEVVERFTRRGNQVLYEVTVWDPEVLVEPWVIRPVTLRLSPNNTIIAERGKCTESELDEVSSQERH